MKIIGISIDGVLRDKLTQFDKMYRKKYIKNESIVKMDEYFRYVPEEEDEGENTRIQNIINEKIKYPIDTFDLLNHYHFDSKKDFLDFLDQDYVFEIYGSAPPVAKAMDKANKLQKIGQTNMQYEILLFSQEQEQAIQATYHFLAKSACRIKKIIFDNDINRIWDYCDMVITDNPNFIESKPNNKLTVKIKSDYNVYDQADYEFGSINEIDDFFIENLIKEKKL
jgi:hypothetical protein